MANPHGSTRRTSLETAAPTSSGCMVFFVRFMFALFVPPHAHPYSCVPCALRKAPPRANPQACSVDMCASLSPSPILWVVMVSTENPTSNLTPSYLVTKLKK